MQKNNILTIVLLVAIVVLVGVLFGKSDKTSNVAYFGDNQIAGGGGKGGGGNTTPTYCQDSDSGINSSIQGTTQTYTQSKNGNKTITASSSDSCANASTVTEFSCSGSAIASQPVVCNTTLGCVNGACAGVSAPDTTAPSASVSSPSNGAIVYCVTNYSTCTANLQANASDNISVAGLKFYNNGQFFIDGYNSNGLWLANLGAVPPQGTYTMTAQATDSAGNLSAMSSPVSYSIVYTDCNAHPELCNVSSF